ncbi:MAG: LysM peptidoglycan-binding domain-containing protein, partial [bacterium]
GTQVPSTYVQPSAPAADPSTFQSQQVAPAASSAAPSAGADQGMARDATVDSGADGVPADRGTLLNGVGHAHAHTDAAQAGAPESDTTGGAQPEHQENVNYEVKHGDNLWDIAHKHFGDGSRWTEIYHANQSIIGDNPSLIHEGTQLQLPGKDIASDYTVKPGDNLWDISKTHMGGGQHWSELYHANAGVIGSNPSMIHPGQHFTRGSEGGASGQLASADMGTHASHHSSLAPAHSTSHLAHSHSTHMAHNTTAHANHQIASKPSEHHLASADKPADHHVAQAQSGAPDHAKLANSRALGEQVALRAQAGSLEPAAPNFSQVAGDAQ